METSALAGLWVRRRGGTLAHQVAEGGATTCGESLDNGVAELAARKDKRCDGCLHPRGAGARRARAAASPRRA